MRKIYLVTLDRFGYVLTAADTVKKKAIATVMTEYETAYEKINGVNPKNDESDRSWSEGKTAYEVALEDIVIEDLECGKCEWR